MLTNNYFITIVSKVNMLCRVCVGLPPNCRDTPYPGTWCKPTCWWWLGPGICISERGWFTQCYFHAPWIPFIQRHFLITDVHLSLFFACVFDSQTVGESSWAFKVWFTLLMHFWSWKSWVGDFVLVDLCWLVSRIWKQTQEPQFSISNIHLQFRLQQAPGFILGMFCRWVFQKI